MRCKTPHCLNDSTQGRKNCNKCRKRKDRLNNPIRCVYDARKCRASERGIEFTITLKYFTNWCIENNYINLRGRNAEDMTIDRIKNELGYVEGNLQMISNRANAKKRWSDAREKKWLLIVPKGVELGPEAPF